MTALDFYVAPDVYPKHALTNTIYRDTPLTNRAWKPAHRPFRSRLFAAAPPDERVSDGILIGLAALTLPVVVGSFAQLWSLLAGGSLERAIRAFLS